MITISAIGRLMAAPEARQTANGAPMATVQLAVRPKAEADAVPIDVIAFGSAAKALGEHQQGDLVQLFGRLQRNTWRDRSGAEHSEWGVIADQVMSARTAGQWQRPIDGPRQRNPGPHAGGWNSTRTPAAKRSSG